MSGGFTATVLIAMVLAHLFGVTNGAVAMPDLADYRWQNRLLLVFAPSLDDDAYGRQTVFTAAGADGNWFTSDDTFASNGVSAVDNEYMYTGRRLNPEALNYYFRYRYYDAVRGRFVSRDPIGSWGDAGNKGNPYSFVGGSVYSYVDPYGNARKCASYYSDVFVECLCGEGPVSMSASVSLGFSFWWVGLQWSYSGTVTCDLSHLPHGDGKIKKRLEVEVCWDETPEKVHLKYSTIVVTRKSNYTATVSEDTVFDTSDSCEGEPLSAACSLGAPDDGSVVAVASGAGSDGSASP